MTWVMMHHILLSVPDGVRLDCILLTSSSSMQGIDRKRLAKLSVECYLEQLLTYGFFHAGATCNSSMLVVRQAFHVHACKTHPNDRLLATCS